MSLAVDCASKFHHTLLCNYLFIVQLLLFSGINTHKDVFRNEDDEIRGRYKVMNVNYKLHYLSFTRASRRLQLPWRWYSNGCVHYIGLPVYLAGPTG